ncbi:hypothetical protein HPHPA20_0336 [Helicobacter pylori Hp A-20]|nr:hypothetical protein HPHPA20_0336 [Helicobacter pylori Hp A-20]
MYNNGFGVRVFVFNANAFLADTSSSFKRTCNPFVATLL